MPRSGSTLQYNLVRGIVEAMGKGRGEGFFTPQQADQLCDQYMQWAEDSKFHIIKTQQLFDGLTPLLETGKTKLCYTYRDLRDVAASFERRFKCEGKDLFRILDDIVQDFYTIQQIDNLISVQYEKMTANIDAVTAQMATALNLAPTQAEINDIAQEFSFEKAQKKIQKFELRYKIEDAVATVLNKCGATRFVKFLAAKMGIQYIPPYFDPKTLMHADHIAPKGSTREDYLSKEQIDYITETYHDWLTEQGYLPEQ